MRKEANLEQWKELYEVATELGDLEPWKNFWDMDLLAVRNGEEEDTVFYSLLGRGGDCYGITVYEGYEALNTFMMLTLQEKMNLSSEYAMFHQKNLTCYWGNRDELSDKQRKIIKDLGYKYRGRNQWLYFMSFEQGYYPYNLNEDEVLRMTEHLHNLQFALKCYEEAEVKVDFEGGNMFRLSYGKDKKTWRFGEEPIPFTSFQYGNLIITDEDLLEELREVPKSRAILEADNCVMMASVSDKKYDRPANPMLSIICDSASGVALACEMSGPDEEAMAKLASSMIDFIFRHGAPKEVRVSNVIVEAGLEQLCEVCKIKLRRVKRLPAIEEFHYGMKRFM